MNRLRIIQLHIAQSGGTWLNYQLHRCLTPPDQMIRSEDWTVQGDRTIPAAECVHGVLPGVVPMWERDWEYPPAMKISHGVMWNSFVGSVGHRTVTEFMTGGGDDEGWGEGDLQLEIAKLKGKATPGTHRWWNPLKRKDKEWLINEFQNYTKIGVVRNPFELLVSRYRTAKRAGFFDDTFDIFLDCYFGDREAAGSPWQPLAVYNKVWTKDLYAAWYHPDGRCGIDVILRNENLAHALFSFLINSGYCSQQRAQDCIETDQRYRDNTYGIEVVGDVKTGEGLVGVDEGLQRGALDRDNWCMDLPKMEVHKKHPLEDSIAHPGLNFDELPTNPDGTPCGGFYEAKIVHRPENAYDYRDYYTENTRKIVEENCAYYLKEFRYEFEGPKQPLLDFHSYVTTDGMHRGLCGCVFANNQPKFFAHSCGRKP